VTIRLQKFSASVQRSLSKSTWGLGRLLGDVYAGERVTHAVMGILYGGMLAFLAPVVVPVVGDADRPRTCASGDGHL
jgi:hypothetical protein